MVAFNTRNYEQAQARFSINTQTYSHWGDDQTADSIRFAQASTLLSFFTLLCRSEKNLQDYTEGRRQTLPFLALLKIMLNHASFSF